MSFTQLVKLANANGYQQIYGYIEEKAKSLYDLIAFISLLDSQVLLFLLDSYIGVLYIAAAENRNLTEPKRIYNAIRHTLAKRFNVKEM